MEGIPTSHLPAHLPHHPCPNTTLRVTTNYSSHTLAPSNDYSGAVTPSNNTSLSALDSPSNSLSSIHTYIISLHSECCDTMAMSFATNSNSLSNASGNVGNSVLVLKKCVDSCQPHRRKKWGEMCGIPQLSSHPILAPVIVTNPCATHDTYYSIALTALGATTGRS